MNNNLSVRAWIRKGTAQALLWAACLGNVCAAEPLIQLGIVQGEAAKQNVEFQQYDRMQPVYKANGIQASLCEFSGFYQQDWTEDQLYQMLKQYHVVHLLTPDEGVGRLTPALVIHAKVVGAALARYVQEGGGLLLQPQAVRYRGTDDERYWNLVFEPLGLQMLHEGVYDPTRTFTGQILGSKVQFWWTQDVTAHPVTAGVKTLYLPLDAFCAVPGLEAMKYSTDWQVVVSGEKEAKSYQCDAENLVDLQHAGTFSSMPPVVAVRQFGHGRIVCYPISQLYTGMNYLNPVWDNTSESAGDPQAGRPSDGMKLQMNCYHWLAEPSLQIADFGTYKPEPYKTVAYPPSVTMDQVQFGHPSDFLYPDGQKPAVAAPTNGVRGIMGAHTSYTDGKGTVGDYVKAAKAAGLSFIVFSDPLERLTPETLAKLKADCAAASKDPDFYACPGIEFSDNIGNRWVWWGEDLVFPDKSFQGTTSFAQWDGQRVHCYGQYAGACNYPCSALLDYKQLRANGAHPENLWWFYHYLPLAYDKDKLIADNYADYLFGLRDLRWAALMSFTRLHEPADVAIAARTWFTSFPNLASVKSGLKRGIGNDYKNLGWENQYVSQGPVIADWEALNVQMEDNWEQTRGAQRVRMHFIVRSENGIAEVKVHDADFGLLRRFEGHGAKELERAFELVDDKQHYVELEVIDKAGKRAFSQFYFIFSYKQGLFRCGDNMNILGATSLVWHPDRNQMLPLFKTFENGDDFSLRGWDTSGPICPMPGGQLPNTIDLKGDQGYPQWSKTKAMVGTRMDLGLSSYNLQIVTMHMDHLSRMQYPVECPEPAWSTVPKDVGELEYFERTDTIYAPMDRIDYYTEWNYRRPREAQQNYRGAFIWHEGEIRFKKDVTLAGAVPIPLAQMSCPTDLERHWGDTFFVTDADGVTRKAVLHDLKKPLSIQGRIRPGGYAAQMPTLVGYEGFLAPRDSDFAYALHMPGQLIIGLGHDGQQIKAGTILKYRFAVGSFTDAKGGNELLEHTVSALNLNGGHAGYPVEMKVGEIADALFFFTAKAKGGEAVFTLGPQNLMIDLPIRVQGLTDNGCAAVYSTKRPWFRFVSVVNNTAYFQEPIDQANEMWVGNVFVTDNPAVKITVVIDGQAEGKKPFLEVHNPTKKSIRARLWSPEHTPLFGGMATMVDLPAGDSLFLTLNGKQFEKR